MDTFQYPISTANLLTSSIHLTKCFGLIQSLLSQIPGSGCCYTHCNKVPFKIQGEHKSTRWFQVVIKSKLTGIFLQNWWLQLHKLVKKFLELMYLQSHIYKNIPVSFDFITTWNQGVFFVCSPCMCKYINNSQCLLFQLRMDSAGRNM